MSQFSRFREEVTSQFGLYFVDTDIACNITTVQVVVVVVEHMAFELRTSSTLINVQRPARYGVGTAIRTRVRPLISL